MYKDQRLTWTGAADYCKSRGSNYRLAFPRTLADIEAMRQEMKAIGTGGYYFWIGLNSQVSKTAFIQTFWIGIIFENLNINFLTCSSTDRVTWTDFDGYVHHNHNTTMNLWYYNKLAYPKWRDHNYEQIFSFQLFIFLVRKFNFHFIKSKKAWALN